MCRKYMDKVTVIVPVYNAEKFISDGIKSVLNQNYENIELILIYVILLVVSDIYHVIAKEVVDIYDFRST